MIRAEANSLVTWTRRVLIELLVWLPAWLILTYAYELTGKLLMLGAGIFFFISGLFLYERLSPLWSRFTLIILLVMVMGIGLIVYRHDWLTFVWLGVMLWRGRYPHLYARFYGYAFLLSGVAVFIARQNEELSDYRIGFIALSLIWVIAWFLSINRAYLYEAGLGNGIVTGPVRRATLRYLLIFLGVALLVFALTVNYGQKLLTPADYVPSEKKWVDVTELRPPAQPQPGLGDMPGKGEPSAALAIFWNILSGIALSAAVIGLIWFVTMLWRDRTWSWRGFLQKLRAWLVKEKRAEAVPYIEERRSLLKDKKKGENRWNTLFQRQHRGKEWSQLNNAQKVRRLYEDAVRAGIEQGYSFRAHHTSAETLDGMVGWRASVVLPEKDKRSSYWERLLSIRQTLISLYEKARYSPHSVTDEEVEELNKALNK